MPPGDVDALRAAIVRLLGDPDEAARSGRAGRAWAVEQAGVIEAYAERLARRSITDGRAV